MATLLETRGLAKAYASPVLADINFDLRAGEVHALVGENGAGKSTLCNIIAGLSRADSGKMFLEERPYEPVNKKAAEHQGVRIVLQELSLIDNLSVAENLFLHRLPNRMGWIQGSRLARAARAALDRVGLIDLDPNVSVRQLGIGQKQLVEIAAGLSQECKILILDEPTAALTVTDAKRLFVQVRKLQAAGVGIVFISHHLEEVQDIADRVSVLRDGRLVAVNERGSFSIDDIIRLMVRRDLGESLQRRNRDVSRRVLLRVEKLKAPPIVREVTFEARAGEILGFAGLMGSGRTETMRAIFGADRRAAGKIFVNGKEVQIDQPAEAVKCGIGLLTEDRKAQGLLLPKPLRINISLARLGYEIGRFGWINRAVGEKVAESWVRRLAVRCSSAEQAARNLSGGNQQKVVLARWLYRDCDILICDEPTRGIDVGAKFEIYRLLGELAADGKAIVVVSSDLKELLALCDRIAVMSAGKLVTEFRRGEWTEDRIMSAAFSELTKTPAASVEQNGTSNGGGSVRPSNPMSFTISRSSMQRSSEQPPNPRTPSISRRRFSQTREIVENSLGLVIVLILLIALFSFQTAHFFSATTFQAIANEIPTAIFIAIGMTFVLIIGGIDLSVGSVLALGAGILGVAIVQWHWPLWAAITLCVVSGAICGLLNGFLTIRFRLPSFIVTLGLMEAARGATYLVTNSQTMYIGSAVEGIDNVTLFGLSLPFLVAITFAIVAQFVLTGSVFWALRDCTGNK